VDKRYHAVVQGLPDPSRGTIDAPIDRHPKHDYKFRSWTAGRPSVTHYEVIEAFRNASLVDVKLETGRTHQIRLHFAALAPPMRRRPSPTAPTRPCRNALSCNDSGCTPAHWASSTRRTARWSVHQSLSGRSGPRPGPVARHVI